MTNNTSSDAKKHHENAKTDGQNIFLSSSWDGLVQNFMPLSCTKQQHFTLSSVPAHCFSTTLKCH